MKKFWLIFIILLFHYEIYGQQFLSLIAESLAKETVKTIQKNNITGAKKIAILNFCFNNGYSDTIHTELGIALTKKFEQKLMEELQKRNLPMQVLVSNQVADNLMEDFFVMPTGTNQSDFWKQYLNGITPDYYISGAYKLSELFNVFSTENVKLLANNYDQQLTDVAITDLNVNVTSAEEKKYLLSFSTVNNLKDLADFITYQIKFQTNIKNITLLNFTFEENNLPSNFSARLQTEMLSSLTQIGKYQVTQGATRGIFNRTDNTPYTLSGSYRVEDQNLRIMANLKNQNNVITASITCYLPLQYIENLNISYKPVSEEVSNEIQEIVVEETIQNSFEINVWTNKGNENVVFKEGEVLQLFVMTEKECYVRFIYIMADRTAVLFLDNYEITADKVGTPIELPYRFKCAPPFGVETLIMSAQTTPFTPLRYTETNGYKIISENLQNIIDNSRRGFVVHETKFAEKIIKFVTTN